MFVSIKNSISHFCSVRYFSISPETLSFALLNSSRLIALICPTPNVRFPPANFLKSAKKISSAVLFRRLLPAVNISVAYPSISLMPAIFARFSAAILSTFVHVGERKAKVSDKIADSIMPAISAGISTAFSIYIL